MVRQVAIHLVVGAGSEPALTMATSITVTTAPKTTVTTCSQ